MGPPKVRAQGRDWRAGVKASRATVGMDRVWEPYGNRLAAAAACPGAHARPVPRPADRGRQEGAFRPLFACGEFTPEDIWGQIEAVAGPTRPASGHARPHCGVEGGACRDHAVEPGVGVVEGERAAVAVGDGRAGFGGDQGARRHVPFPGRTQG